MQEVAPGIGMIDTRLGGVDGITSAYLVDADRPALVETGARTSAPALRAGLAEAGLGADDLAWIVLTHVHLDHCGGTGILASAFPRATVVVHRRGARHLAEPGRLVAASAAVYGRRWSIYGGLDRTAAGRIAPAEDGHLVPLGAGRELVMLETTGHARHHMSVLDEATGTLFAGDAVGARIGGAGLYPTLPPPDLDLEAGARSLDRLAALAPGLLCLSHFGPAPDPLGDIALARDQLARAGAAARAAGAGRDALRGELERALPLEPAVADAGALARWRRLAWAETNVDGLEGWRERA